MLEVGLVDEIPGATCPMPTKVSVQDSRVAYGELKPAVPALEAWKSDPLATALRAASDRLCLWDYRQHVPAVTFFQVWQSRLQLQNVYMNREPYLFPLRGAAVLHVRKLWGQDQSDIPQLRLSARLRLHPTADPFSSSGADRTSEDSLDADSDGSETQRRWLPGFFRNRDRRWKKEKTGTFHAGSIDNHFENFRLPGRIYLKLGTTIHLPGLMLWVDRADRQRRSLYTTLVRRQSATWWGFEWDLIRRLEGSRSGGRPTRRHYGAINITPSCLFLHASWIPVQDDGALRLIAGIQHKFRIASSQHKSRDFRKPPMNNPRPNRFLQLTLRFGIDLLRGGLYITPVADGTYF